MYIEVVASEGAAVIQTTGNRLFHVIGTSTSTSALTGEKVPQTSIHPEKDRSGVIVIADFTTGHRGWSVAPLGFHWKDGKLIVDSGNDAGRFFNPSRVGQVYIPDTPGKMPWIEVQIGKRRFTTNPERTNTTTHLVDDPDLLCRYWAGNIDAVEVIHAAVESKKTRSEMEKMRIQLARAEANTLENQRILVERNKEIDHLRSRCAELAEQLPPLAEEVIELRSLTREIANCLDSKWLKTRVVADLIARANRTAG